LPDSAAGKRARCKACDTIFVVEPLPPTAKEVQSSPLESSPVDLNIFSALGEAEATAETIYTDPIDKITPGTNDTPTADENKSAKIVAFFKGERPKELLSRVNHAGLMLLACVLVMLIKFPSSSEQYPQNLTSKWKQSERSSSLQTLLANPVKIGDILTLSDYNPIETSTAWEKNTRKIGYRKDNGYYWMPIKPAGQASYATEINAIVLCGDAFSNGNWQLHVANRDNLPRSRNGIDEKHVTYTKILRGDEIEIRYVGTGVSSLLKPPPILYEHAENAGLAISKDVQVYATEDFWTQSAAGSVETYPSYYKTFYWSAVIILGLWGIFLIAKDLVFDGPLFYENNGKFSSIMPFLTGGYILLMFVLLAGGLLMYWKAILLLAVIHIAVAVYWSMSVSQHNPYEYDNSFNRGLLRGLVPLFRIIEGLFRLVRYLIYAIKRICGREKGSGQPVMDKLLRGTMALATLAMGAGLIITEVHAAQQAMANNVFDRSDEAKKTSSIAGPYKKVQAFAEKQINIPQWASGGKIVKNNYRSKDIFKPLTLAELPQLSADPSAVKRLGKTRPLALSTQIDISLPPGTIITNPKSMIIGKLNGRNIRLTFTLKFGKEMPTIRLEDSKSNSCEVSGDQYGLPIIKASYERIGKDVIFYIDTKTELNTYMPIGDAYYKISLSCSTTFPLPREVKELYKAILLSIRRTQPGTAS